MTMLDGVLAGIVQGLTEFLPVSSSGHLALLSRLAGWHNPEAQLGFVIALHLASVVAVMLFVAREIGSLFTSQKRLLWLMALATLPLGVLGVLFHETVSAATGSLAWIGVFFLVTAGLLLSTRWMPEGTGRAVDLSPVRALIAGFGQALGMFPGVSRSGAALTACLRLGLEREQAVRFTFLLAIPAILGAALYTGVKDGLAVDVPAGVLLPGMAASFASSLVGMRVLALVVRRKGLPWFALYCGVLGVVALVFGLR